MIGKALIIGLCGIFSCAPASSVELQRGRLMLDPGYSMPQEPFADSKTRAAALGLQLTPQLEFGVQQLVNYAGMADAEQIWDKEEIWRGRTSGFANFDLARPDQRFVPFVGAFAGVDYDAADAAAFMGPHAGFSQYLDSHTFMRVRYRYEWQMDDIEGRDFSRDADKGEHIISLGLGIDF